MSQTNDPFAHASDAPLQSFHNCHSGILTQLDRLAELPALLVPAVRARQIAADALAFFHTAVFEHHADEERELFPAVLASAVPGEEHDGVQTIVTQLTAEHRVIEQTWKHLEPELKQVAKGHDAALDITEVQHLVNNYRAHAAYEEERFLPLAHSILGRNSNHMAALGLSLHMRHSPVAVSHI